MKSGFAIHIKPIEIPLKVRFKQASFDRSVSESLWVKVERSSFTGLGEGCPRDYVTGEDLNSAISWLSGKKVQIQQECTSLDELQLFVKK